MSFIDHVKQLVINPFTNKIISKIPSRNLLAGIIVRPDIETLYREYQGKCEQYLPSLPHQDQNVRDYYVYAWYGKTKPKSYFYVGKGKNNRWRHILSDIKKVETGNKHNARFEQYKIIKDSCGIDCDFLLEGLTELEALIAEQCIKLKLIDEGEQLLNIEGMPEGKMSAGGWKVHDTSEPHIEDDLFYRKYEKDYGDPKFDNVISEDLLRVWFYPFFIQDMEKFGKNKLLISNYIIEKGGKVYQAQHPSVNTRSIIVSGALEYKTYAKYREQGKRIFSIVDILKFIPEVADSGMDLSALPEKNGFEQKEEDVINYIKGILTNDFNVPSSEIAIQRYHDELTLQIGNSHARTGHIFIKVYKKRPGGYITIPLNEAGDLKPKLTHITNWKGNYEFAETKDLDELKSFFWSQCQRALYGRLVDKVIDGHANLSNHP